MTKSDPSTEIQACGVIVSASQWTQAAFDPEDLAARAVNAVARELGDAGERAVAVAFSNDAEIAALSRLYRGVDKPTNVLAFPAAEPPPGAPVHMLGDVIVSYETIAKEAADLGLTIEARTAHMIVHGCLHLHGYDHQTDDDALTMQSLETRALAQLGYPDPYAEEGGRQNAAEASNG